MFFIFQNILPKNIINKNFFSNNESKFNSNDLLYKSY